MNKWLILLFYNLTTLPFYLVGYPFAAIFNRKFRSSLPVRLRLRRDIQKLRKTLKENDRLVWIHSSSMGEFEQARPMIEAMKKVSDSNRIVATFFSASGYENRKNYPNVDLVQYLPFDFFWSVWFFYRHLRPDAGILIRYEFWPNLILLAPVFNVRLMLINASLKPGSVYGQWWLSPLFAQIFSTFQKIITVSDVHSKRFRKIVPFHPQIISLGDTRADQVMIRAKTKKPELDKLPSSSDQLTVIGGSTWLQDERLLISACHRMQKDGHRIRLILVPHEIKSEKVHLVQSLANGLTIRTWSEYEGEDFDILWFDQMGFLMNLYAYGDAAFVGGGFGVGIHNILEPAVYGIPVAHGPNYFRSPEGVEMQFQSITTVIQTETDMINWFKWLLLETENRIETGRRTRQYVEKSAGVTQKIINMIGSPHAS